MAIQNEHKAFIQAIEDDWEDYKAKIKTTSLVWWVVCTVFYVVVGAVASKAGATDDGAWAVLTVAMLCTIVGVEAGYWIKLFWQANVKNRLIRDQGVNQAAVEGELFISDMEIKRGARHGKTALYAVIWSTVVLLLTDHLGGIFFGFKMLG